jgi:hypothetical protein
MSYHHTTLPPYHHMKSLYFMTPNYTISFIPLISSISLLLHHFLFSTKRIRRLEMENGQWKTPFCSSSTMRSFANCKHQLCKRYSRFYLPYSTLTMYTYQYICTHIRIKGTSKWGIVRKVGICISFAQDPQSQAPFFTAHKASLLTWDFYRTYHQGCRKINIHNS